MKPKKYLFYFIALFVLSSCSTTIVMTSSNMSKLELGMTKKQVTSILGPKYIIAEKRIENNMPIEILSYRGFDELYKFLFMDDKLEKWYTELVPKYEITKQ